MPVTLNGNPSGFDTANGEALGLADFEDEEEMAATDRYGMREEAGFAVHPDVRYADKEILRAGESIPRNASAAADLVEDNILSIKG